MELILKLTLNDPDEEEKKESNSQIHEMLDKIFEHASLPAEQIDQIAKLFQKEGCYTEYSYF